MNPSDSGNAAITPAGPSSTALPPGNCGMHGYHGYVTCPRCSTSAIPPARIVAPTQPPPKPSDARSSVVAPQRGWECPKCGSVYAPWVFSCGHCAPKRTYGFGGFQ